MEVEGLDLGCRQMGVGKVAAGFTLRDSCCGCLLITTTGGQRRQEVILVQNTQIRQSTQGLAIISGRPSKPITHQGSRRSGNLFWLAAGHTLPRGPLASLCTQPPRAPNVAGVGRGVPRVAADGCGGGRDRRPELGGTGVRD